MAKSPEHIGEGIVPLHMHTASGLSYNSISIDREGEGVMAFLGFG